MGVNLSKQEQDQFAIDLYGEVHKVIEDGNGIADVKIIMQSVRAFVINSDVFDNYALSCKLDLVLNSLIKSNLVKLVIGFANDNVRIRFVSAKK
jgi:hypothetical protein